MMKHHKSIIPKTWEIPEIFRSRLGQDVGRQRLMLEEDHLLVVLHQVPSAAEKSKREAAIFWVNASNEWKSTPESGGRSALLQLVTQFNKRLISLDLALDKATDAHQVFEVLEEAAPLYRASRNQLRVLQELREVLADDSEVLGIRDLSIQNERAAELLMSDAKATLDYQTAASAAHQAKEAAKSANEAKKLNRLAALFFPTVTLASIFGTNAPKGVLEYPSTGIVLAAGALCGVALWAILKSGDKN